MRCMVKIRCDAALLRCCYSRRRFGVALTTRSTRWSTTRFYAKVSDLMKRDALRKLPEGEDAVFKGDVAFKYADDDDVLRRLCGLA